MTSLLNAASKTFLISANLLFNLLFPLLGDEAHIYDDIPSCRAPSLLKTCNLAYAGNFYLGLYQHMCAWDVNFSSDVSRQLQGSIDTYTKRHEMLGRSPMYIERYMEDLRAIVSPRHAEGINGLNFARDKTKADKVPDDDASKTAKGGKKVKAVSKPSQMMIVKRDTAVKINSVRMSMVKAYHRSRCDPKQNGFIRMDKVMSSTLRVEYRDMEADRGHALEEDVRTEDLDAAEAGSQKESVAHNQPAVTKPQHPSESEQQHEAEHQDDVQPDSVEGAADEALNLKRALQ